MTGLARRFPTRTEMIVLRGLRHSPMYGFELADHISGVSMKGIHSLLGRLKQQRYVEIAGRVLDCPGMPRPIYGITDDGKACIELADELKLWEVP